MPSNIDTTNERYDFVKDLGSGNYGAAKLMKDKVSGEQVAVKFIERGEKIDKYVERETENHFRLPPHHNIIQFLGLLLSPTHLGIILEYAPGGELFDLMQRRKGRLGEDEARFYFQQLIAGVGHLHAQGVCHRDLKLENTLLDASRPRRLKVIDFGFAKSAVDSLPGTTVGTPAYVAPEVLTSREYDGQLADVWSCGVLLFVMVVGTYPFCDPAAPHNNRETIKRISKLQYAFPPAVRLSNELHDLIARIFVKSPLQRIPLAQIRKHPWFLKNLPPDDSGDTSVVRLSTQSEEEIKRILGEARHKPASKAPAQKFNEEDFFEHGISSGSDYVPN